jgi:copper chaperone CopZ
MVRIARFLALPHRLLVAPRLSSIRHDGASSTIAVEGLVCSVCASRTRTAFARIPGVQAVEVDLERGQAVVLHELPLDRRALEQALDAVVVLRGVRRFIHRVTRRAQVLARSAV